MAEYQTNSEEQTTVLGVQKKQKKKLKKFELRNFVVFLRGGENKMGKKNKTNTKTLSYTHIKVERRRFAIDL